MTTDWPTSAYSTRSLSGAIARQESNPGRFLSRLRIPRCAARQVGGRRSHLRKHLQDRLSPGNQCVGPVGDVAELKGVRNAQGVVDRGDDFGRNDRLVGRMGADLVAGA